MEPVRAALGVTMYPVQMAVHLPLQAGHWALDMVTLRRTLLEENERLREAQLLTSARLMKLEELEAENRRLRNLLDSSIEAGEQVLIAEVLAVEMDPFTRQLLLNKGSRSKVYRGQPIIDAQGVMGQVIHVNPITATALLITDPSHALPVQFSRNGLRSVAVGTGVGSTLELLHLPNNADVTVGDRVVTSGLGGRFPAGYLVGEVVAVDTETGRPFARVLVEPSAQLERNREVLLVWPPQVPVDGPEGEPGEVAGG
jgi:rod shape-determining protein MreC